MHYNLMYDETEDTKTRYIGFIGQTERFDLMITTTAHFYGKSVVMSIQTGRSAIINHKDLENVPFIQDAFGLPDEAVAEELAAFLLSNM